jgi:hypothetical protein
MDADLENRIKRGKELMLTSRHISLATVNEDSSPHNSPVKFLYDPEIENIFWGSHPESIHSRNITRTGQVFAVLFDRKEQGGLYFKCENAHQLSGQELEIALKIHNESRLKDGKDTLPLSYYTGDNPQRMWGARITNLWVNGAARDENGRLLKDTRMEVSAKDLLSI